MERKTSRIVILILLLAIPAWAIDDYHPDKNIDMDDNDIIDVGKLGVGTGSPSTTVHFSFATTDATMSITQSSVTGTEDVPLIFINDDRTGTTANEDVEATLVMDTEGAYTIYLIPPASANLGKCKFGRVELLSYLDMADNQQINLGGGFDFIMKWDTNGTGDDLFTVITSPDADNSDVMFFSHSDPNNMTDHDNYLSLTPVFTNEQGADTGDYAGVLFGERTQSDVAIAHIFDFYAMTGSVDAAVDPTTTEIPADFSFGSEDNPDILYIDTSAPSVRLMGDLLFSATGIYQIGSATAAAEMLYTDGVDLGTNILTDTHLGYFLGWEHASDNSKMDGEDIYDDSIDEDSPDWGLGAGQINAANIELLHQATATYDDVQDLVSTIFSAGRISGGSITDDGDGTITVASGTGMIKTTDDNLGSTTFINWAMNNSLALTNASMNHIYVTYNGGSPIIGVTTDEADIDEHTEFELGQLYKDNTTLYPAAHGVNLEDFLRYVHNRAHDFGHIRGTGIVISDAGSASRNINLTAGTIWAELTPIAISAQTPATFTTWYHSSGSWTSSTGQTVLNNTQYDDGSDLATLTANRYGTHFVYVGENDTMHVIFGRGDYKLIQAEGSTVPPLPEQVSQMGTLVGRIIIQKNATAFTETATAFKTTFGFTGVTDHAELAGLQGGTTDEYYHLTSANHGYIDQDVTNGASPTFANVTATSVVKAEDLYSTDDARITDEIQDGNAANGVTVAQLYQATQNYIVDDDVPGMTSTTPGPIMRFSIKDPDSDFDDIKLKFERATTVTAVHALCIAGTNAIIRLYEVDSDGDDSDAVGIDSGNYTITTSQFSDTSFTNPTLDANDWLQFDTISVTGSVTNLSITIWGYET